MKKLFRMRIVLLIAFLIFGLTLSATPLDFRKHNFGINLGISFEHNRDEQASPLRYSGHAFPFRLFYSFLGNTNIHHLEIVYKKFDLESAVGHKAEFFYAQFRYNYLRLYRKLVSGKVKIYIGGEWTNSFLFQLYNFPIFYTDGDFGDGEVSSYLSPALSIEQNLSDIKRLNYQISIPLFMYIIRPGYSSYPPDKLMGRNPANVTLMDIVKSGNFVTINQLKGLKVLVRYQEVVSKHFTLNIGYEFNYYHNSYGWPTTSANNQIWITFNWMFGSKKSD